MGLYSIFSLNAGFDFIDIDSNFQVHLCAGFRVGPGSLCIALLMILLNSKFLLEFFIPNLWRQVAVLQPTVNTSANLFHSQLPLARFVETQTDAAAKQEAQPCHEVVSMDATPPTDFKMIHAEFFFADSEFCFNRPASEGHTEQAAKCHAVLAHDGIGQKELCLSGAHVAGNDQRLAFARQPFVRLTPDSQMLDLPDFGPFVSVLDSILLPRLDVKL